MNNFQISDLNKRLYNDCVQGSSYSDDRQVATIFHAFVSGDYTVADATYIMKNRSQFDTFISKDVKNVAKKINSPVAEGLADGPPLHVVIEKYLNNPADNNTLEMIPFLISYGATVDDTLLTGAIIDHIDDNPTIIQLMTLLGRNSFTGTYRAIIDYEVYTDSSNKIESLRPILDDKITTITYTKTCCGSNLRVLSSTDNHTANHR